MHAVVTSVTISDQDSTREFLREQLVPRVSSAPGFVAGYWVAIAEDKGRGVIVFESEEAANAARDQIQPPPGVTMDSIEVGEVVANA